MSADSAYVTSFEMQVEGDSETAGKLDNLAGKVQNVGQAGEVAAKKTSNFTSTMKSSALGITAAAASATTLFFSYDNLQKGELKVDKAEKALTDAKATLITAQESLNKLTEKGIVAGPQYEAAQLKLKSAQDGLQISTDRLGQAQGDLTQQQLNFAMSVVPTSIAMVSSLTDVFGKLKVSKVANIAASLGEASADSAGIGTKLAHAAATAAHTVATGAATVATRLFHIAMGPVGWIILGVSSAMALFATNAFGIRDAINSAGKAIGDFFPIMRPLLDGLSYLAGLIFPEAGKEADKLATEGTNAFSSFSADGSSSFQALASNVDKQTNSMVSDIERLKASMGSVGAMPSGGSSKKSSSGASKALDFTQMAGPFDMRNKANLIDTGGSSGGGRIVLEIRSDEDKIFKIIEKSNSAGIDLVYNGH